MTVSSRDGGPAQSGDLSDGVARASVPIHWALRVAFKRGLARHRLVIEFCEDCGADQPVVWTAPDDLWAAVSGRSGAGVLCPTCFDRRAVAQGRSIRWVPREDGV